MSMSALIEESLRAARSVEKAHALVYPLRQLVEQLDALERHDPDLEPELAALREHLEEASSAATRAMSFIEARFQAAVDRGFT